MSRCRRFAIGVLLTTMWGLLLTTPVQAAEKSAARRIPAFPGAEGFGAYTPGGRGGRVIEVTNLKADGPGSLRAACEAKGPRVVVFRVSGQIKTSVTIKEPFITIAGQTAPGDGICLRNGKLAVNAHDVIVRYLRARPGDHPIGPGADNRDTIAVGGSAEKVHDVVIDHCSGSWGTDENFQVWGAQRNITIQWCLNSESLRDSIHPKGPHGTGMVLGVEDFTVSIHHCLLAHHGSRLPFIHAGQSKQHATVDFRNNLIYNHGPSTCTSLYGPVQLNYVGNFIKPGFDSRRHVCGISMSKMTPQTQVYVEDNIWAAKAEPRKDPWNIVEPSSSPKIRRESRTCRSLKPMSAPAVTTEPPAQAYQSILKHVGCTRPVRDVVDARIVAEVRAGTGHIIDSQEDVGGWPTYASTTPPADDDHDGMPDAWEKKYGFDPKDPTDGPKDREGDGYTNVEEYLNLTDPDKADTGAPIAHPPVVIQSGNERIRGDAARKLGDARLAQRKAPASNNEIRESFIKQVKASGKEAADFLGIRFVRIPKGKFKVGKCNITLTKDYELGATEITQAQWVTVMGGKPWVDQICGKDDPNLPAYYVSYTDCQEFISRLNACGHRKYRLPTYCEWKHAATGGTDSAWGFGKERERVREYAWCSFKYRDKTGELIRRSALLPQAVAKLKPNPWGLYNMAGNVREWCHDWADWLYYRGGDDKTDPMGPKHQQYPGWDESAFRVVCGGSFRYRASHILRYAAGHSSRKHRPHYRNFDTGFRLRREVP